MPVVEPIPVVVVVFNRADFVARMIEALRAYRPTQLFFLMDGPRPGHADDAKACLDVRSAIDTVDWPAEVRSRVATTNLGCSRNILEGLDWVFEQVEQAIILDDDTLPAAGFFPWCAAMLARYRDASDISHVCGRNELGSWPAAGSDHLLARRASTWGWATWAKCWKAFRTSDLSARRTNGKLHEDALVNRHLEQIADAISRGHDIVWDMAWSLAGARAGLLGVLPRTNLISNIGFGTAATRTDFGGDFRGSLPTGSPSILDDECRPARDLVFERWALLVELLAAQRSDARLTRLAIARHLVTDERLQLHLAPFDCADESVAVLRHLAGAGCRSAHLQDVLARMESVANQQDSVPS